jgi:hypothetical protein
MKCVGMPRPEQAANFVASRVYAVFHVIAACRQECSEATETLAASIRRGKLRIVAIFK